jgi:hypothetical protein
MKASISHQKGSFGWTKIAIIILGIMLFCYIIGRLQVGTDDKKDTQKRGPIGAFFISSTALFLFVVE